MNIMERSLRLEAVCYRNFGEWFPTILKFDHVRETVCVVGLHVRLQACYAMLLYLTTNLQTKSWCGVKKSLI